MRDGTGNWKRKEEETSMEWMEVEGMGGNGSPWERKREEEEER